MSLPELQTIVELSREFGTDDFVLGGGGNTSVKDAETLWVKPSGSTLAGLTVGNLVAMNREKIDRLFAVETPGDSAAREEQVNEMMAAAVENDAGRPSVEAPLHNVFDARFVVHTHPALVNGLTCAAGGEAACRRLFPDALWIAYIDPGYTLSMEVRARMEQYKSERGREPAIVMLQNHGIFIAGDAADEIRSLYGQVMDTLSAEYVKAGVSLVLKMADAVESAGAEEKIKTLFGDNAAYLASGGRFAVVPGPITPDHLVYARAFPYTGALTEAGAATYVKERGYYPKVVVHGERVYGIGSSQKNAELALELAKDGALVMQLAEAFGGIRFMTDAQREFIENWEVESYRAKQVYT